MTSCVGVGEVGVGSLQLMATGRQHTSQCPTFRKPKPNNIHVNMACNKDLESSSKSNNK